MKQIFVTILLALPLLSISQSLSKTPSRETEGWFVITSDPDQTHQKIIQVLKSNHITGKVKDSKALLTIKTDEIKGNFEGTYKYDISYSKYDTVQGFYFDIIYTADNGYTKSLRYTDSLFTKALAPFLDSFEIVYLSPKSVVELPVNKMLIENTKDYYLNKAGNQTIGAEVIFVASSLITLIAASQKDGGKELFVISGAGFATSIALRFSAGVNLKRAAKAIK